MPAATDELHELKIKSGLGSGISESGGRGDHGEFVKDLLNSMKAVKYFV